MKRSLLILWVVTALVWSNFEVQAAISLQNPQWKVEIEPETLAIKVLPVGKQATQASVGTAPQPASQVRVESEKATWRWGSYSCLARLSGPDLFISIRGQSAATLEVLRQPSSTLGQALILPLAEGHYIPIHNELWRDFLVNKLKETDTSEGLSLPLWGANYGDYSLHWILTNPFYNRLLFGSDSHKDLELSLQHSFARLTPQTPFTFFLHLGGTDLLSGAKRYRTWLVSEGRYETLRSKIAKTPEAKKLLGATHIYLWGNGLLAPANVKNWDLFLAQLRTGAAAELGKSLDQEAREILKRCGLNPNHYEQRILISALNKVLEDRVRSQWLANAEDVGNLVKSYDSVRREVAKDFGVALDSNTTNWGGTLTPDLFQRLADAGLKRLWLGLGDGWEGGLWHPEAVAAAVSRGFLIAPYDSYQTALHLEKNHAWTTAHLGTNAPELCGIMQENGKLQSGFQENGCYTNPRLIRPLLEARVQAIQKQAGFNSWFLDAYATGMVFDDYRSDQKMAMAQSALENEASSRWIAETLHLPNGSEGGNAVTSRGILFAHGMQTPYFAWQDPDFKKKTSPYYLGGWWPPDAPAIFFRATPVKEPYRTVYFDPTTRLPLYQAVFHGSVITTHHWSFDNLKLSNVRMQNELVQLLYNVPPLYHLSASTLAARLPWIVRQDAFFRSLHERLGLEALTEFSWLTPDHLVQQTVFSDGTHLIANFGKKPYHMFNVVIPASAIVAICPSQSPLIYRVPSLPKKGACVRVSTKDMIVLWKREIY